MYEVCNICGIQPTKLSSGERGMMKEIVFGMDGRNRVSVCEFCRKKYEQEYLRQDGLTPYATPMISPTVSLRSIDSFVTSTTEFSVDANTQAREDGDGGARYTSHNYLKSTIPSPKGIDGFGTNLLERLESSSSDQNTHSLDSRKLRDIQIKESDDGPDRIKNATDRHNQLLASPKEETELSNAFDIETDPSIWLPPEPEDVEDDLEGSVANNDNDDEYIDGTKWVQPSLASSCSFRFKREFQNEMSDVMNGKFKCLVSQLLKAEGIFISKEAGESWVDIVTSLAWEAALFVKPDAAGGQTMDPEGYVKVKCIPTGLRSQSQLVKGLVFKKSASHKHMPTKCKNPRILLLKGTLGQNSSGLSSFHLMEQEKDNLKSITEMIELAHPNMVLVEKTVSRDVQELLLRKAITLVFDMKIDRLKRIARCTGSQIFSSADSLTSQRLKQCSSFHFEKFLEEIDICREGRKRLTKTLMFLEGFPRPLGCTVLLKGAPRNELKMIKFVVHSAAVVAYHLLLETSFLVDQMAMLSTVHSRALNEYQKDEVPILFSGTSLRMNGSSLTECSSFSMDIPISDGLAQKPTHESAPIPRNLSDNMSSYQLEIATAQTPPSILPGQLLSSLSASFNQSFSTYFDYKEREPEIWNIAVVPFYAPSEAATCHATEAKDSREDMESPSSEPGKDTAYNDDKMRLKGDINTVLDVQSILFLMSSQSVLKRTVCEQIHLYRIKYYRHFDTTLGRFLCDSLLNQRRRCVACGDLPEAHSYNYVHRSGKLTIRVKQLSAESCLPGEAEGKLWMWAQCSKCDPKVRNEKSTRRVVMSTAARGLSFGKFLELSFSNHSNASRLSSCGHSLHRDYLRFYGLGPVVTMFRYSPVDIYAACMPTSVLEFKNPIGQYWIQQEAAEVLKKGMSLFSEVINLLKLRSSSIRSKAPINPPSFTKEYPKVEEMLNLEKSDFEGRIQKFVDKNEHFGKTVHELLNLNHLSQELVLESYVWDRRCHSLLLSDLGVGHTGDAHKAVHEEVQFQQHKHVTLDERNPSQCGDKISDVTATNVSGHSNSKAPSSSNGNNAINLSSNPEAVLESKLDEISITEKENSVKEIQVSQQCDGVVLGSVHLINEANSSIDGHASRSKTMESFVVDGPSHDEPTVGGGVFNSSFPGEDPCNSQHHLSPCLSLHDTTFRKELLGNSEASQMQRTVPSIDGFLRSTGSIIKESGYKGLEQGMSVSQKSIVAKLDDPEGWFWAPFSEIHKAYKKDKEGISQKFGFINNYTPECLSSTVQLINEERNRLHVPVGPDDNVVSAYEGEPTSIIACALAMMHEEKELVEKEGRRETGEDEKTTDIAPSLSSDVSVASPYWSSTDSVDSEGSHSKASVPSEDSYTSLFDPVFNSLPTVENPHPEFHIGVQKLLGKGKYSVMCLYAKEFRDLRKRCCACEIDYIGSLSRCKNWDAKGGKSGSGFVKTLDDRFVVKQIKKTEFDSFLKFAPDYFIYINQSLDSGSQTCLAKILGIYQVTIRQEKSGKEVKYDLVVMENLLFGRNITRIYDLKGAQHSRYTSNADGMGKVCLDQNFVEDMSTSPLYISVKTKRLLQRAIWNDTTFLTSINVMDYSLLVGVDVQRLELVYGIIDYLRQYTWDKHLETWVKASLVVPKNVSPTVVSPKEYKKRFRKFMSAYFLSVPDHPSVENFEGLCKFCGSRSKS